MSILYDLLKKKALEHKDEIAIIGGMHFNETVNYFSMSYSAFLNLVNEYLEKLKDPSYVLQPVVGRKYIVVDNSINSIAIIVALLEIGATPVIIDTKNVPELSKDNIPYVCHGNPRDSRVNQDEILCHKLWNSGIFLDKYAGEEKDGPKLMVYSSGTESAAHIKVITEEELTNLPIQYGENNGVFYSYVSCAHISGVLTNLVNFLVHDNKLFLVQDFNLEDICFVRNYNQLALKNKRKKYVEKRYFLSTANPSLIDLVIFNSDRVKGEYYDETHIEGDELVVKEISEEYRELSWDMQTALDYLNGNMMKPDSLMLPRNILDYIEKIDPKGVDLSSLKHIYMTGGMNSEDIIKVMRQKFPSIKEGVFTNLYGSTEANGVISYCNEKDLKTCYIDVSESELGKIRYTYDHKTFYELIDGVVTEIDVPEDTFSYMPYLSASSERVPDVTIDGVLDIAYRGEPTGDIGIYIDNQLYILGRKKELVKVNGRSYIINALESYFRKALGLEIFLIADSENEIQPYIKVDKIDDYEGITEKYAKCLEFSKSFNMFHVNPPAIIDNYIFEQSKISGKQPRSFLNYYLEFAKQQQEAFLSGKKGIIEASKEFMQLTNYDYEMLNDGSFVVRLFSRTTMVDDEILECFYKPFNVGRDFVRFVPKPEIVLASTMHMLHTLSTLDIKYRGLGLKFLLHMQTNIDEYVDYLAEEPKPLEEAKTADEIFRFLKHHIVSDFMRRTKNFMAYSCITVHTEEELEKYIEGTTIPSEVLKLGEMKE